MSVLAQPATELTDDRLARRNAVVLSVTQALAGANNTVIIATGGIVGAMLAPERAFATLPDFIRGAGRLVAPGGRLLAMKGRLPADELAALPAGWVAAAVTPVQVPALDAERHMIVVRRSAEAAGPAA